MNLALIIPALDEAEAIGATLARLPAGLARQVIVVDNGSADDTATRARVAGAEVVVEPRRGYGRACLAGLRLVRPEIDAIGILDADGSDDTSRLPEMLALVERDGVDLVIGARVLGEARRHLSPPQRFGNWLASVLIRLGWGHRYHDMGPMRVIRRAALERLAMSDPTWGWNVEMQIKALEHRLRVQELPVTYARRAAGRSKISGNVAGTLRAGGRILATIGRYWWARRRRQGGRA
jgi:glycosyltransferase involved in cell wall biosynthesis